jgi:hypothetical protein
MMETRYDAPPFGGPDVLESDVPRLQGQLDKVRGLMSDGGWRSLETIAKHVGCTTQSASARLRDLRKPKFGGRDVQRMRIGMGVNGAGSLFLYRLAFPDEIEGGS